MTNNKEGIPDIPMLNNPLTTEEGFINEACLKELEQAIRSIPETHIRLSDDPEWSIKVPTTLGEVMGAFAGCAVHQFYGNAPPKLEQIIGYLRVCLKRGMFKNPIFPNDPIVMENVSLCDINRELWNILGELEMFNDWNKEEVVGKDWMDLSALLHNVCLLIRNERRHYAAFDNDFERRHGKLKVEDY